MGLTKQDLVQLAADYLKNMNALRDASLAAGKFSWQMLWTGECDDCIGGTGTQPIVSRPTCAATLRSLCTATSPAQTRAMAYGLSGALWTMNMTPATPENVRSPR